MALPLGKGRTMDNSEAVSKLTFTKSKEKSLYIAIKRLLDIGLSLISLPLVFLLIVLFGIIIKLDSKGPWLYCQERVGRNGRKFNMYKLRSMQAYAEEGDPKWTQKRDPRITRVGKFIRSTRIDETPQIINILKGEMSIVGPRPERLYFVSQFEKELPQYIDRLQVKPGLTGLAQVNGGYDLEVKEKLELDLYYIKNASLGLDIRIILKTAIVVLNREGAR